MTTRAGFFLMTRARAKTQDRVLMSFKEPYDMDIQTLIMSRLTTSVRWNTVPAALAALLLCHVSTAQGSLGGDAASVEADRLHMKAQRPVLAQPSPTGTYSVSETVLPSGTRVRQYVSGAGVVFAVTWSGPFLPDLRQLLGPHFDTLVTQQSKQSMAGHHVFGVREPGLVIESSGRPRNFVGRAYLPGSLPPGLSAEEIK
jgi:hypothetical protein